MQIRMLLKIWHEANYMKAALKRYSGSLACGKYHQHNSFHAFSLDEPETRAKACLYFDKSNAWKRIVSVTSFLNRIGYYSNKNKRSTGEYEGFYVANNYDKVRETKLFSFKNKKILTICTSSSEAEKQIEQYRALGSAYNMPRVERSDKYENAFEISMIDLKVVDHDILALKNICSSTIANNPVINDLHTVRVQDVIAFSFDEEMDSYMKKIADQIDPSIRDMQIPFCVQHGDLSKENLIYGECEGKTDFWWIDWEHMKERVFFYDYFFYILNSALYEDFGPFACYIHDDSNEMLASFFAHFGLAFDASKKLDYFLVYAIDFLKERVCLKSGLPMVERYYNLIEAMKRYAKGEKK